MATGDPGAQPPEEFDAADFQWKIIARYDTYIGATNTKGALLIALTSFVFTSIVLRWTDLTGSMSFRDDQVVFKVLTGIALLVAAIASLIVTWKVIVVIKPQLCSPRKPGQYHSTIFFEHVAEYGKAEDYASAVAALDTPKSVEDLSYQAYALAGILRSKFRVLGDAIQIILWWVIPALGSLILIRLIALCADVIPKLR